MKRFILIAWSFTLILAGCGGPAPLSTPSAIPPTTAASQEPGNPAWWNDTVFYEIFVRSFRDSNGDGIGDFNGIIEKLDYLEELGITGIWLMPIFPSPSYHGYDVTDYYTVNSEYGTVDEFKTLLEEAHKRDIRVIIDLVMNHTSARHPWFEQSLENDSQYKDWYIWSDQDPGHLGPWGQTVWHRASNGKYYFGLFWDQMPDLNFNNPSVRKEIEKITSFWLEDIGVDGFRLDAVRHLVEEGSQMADLPATHSFLKEWSAYYRTLDPQAFTVGEIWTENFTVSTYTKDNLEVDSAFNFDLSSAILKSIREGENSTLQFTVKATVKLFPEQDNSNFLTNHDMPRVMTEFGGNPDQAKAAAGILLTAPGIPFIYYGEEIGMSGTKPDEQIRTPMQWSDEAGAGFTAGTPWEAVNSDFTTINAAAQTGDRASLLEHYRTLIRLRNAQPALKFGSTYVAEPSSKQLLAYLRADEEQALLVIVNLGEAPVQEYQLELDSGPLSGTYAAASLLDDSEMAALQANANGGFDAYTPLAEIPPYTVMVIELTPQ